MVSQFIWLLLVFFWGKVKHILNWEKPAGHFPLDSSDLVFLSGDSRARHTHRWQRVSWPRILCVPKLVKYTVKVLCRCRFGMAENRLKWRDDYWGRHGETAVKFRGVGMNIKLNELCISKFALMMWIYGSWWHLCLLLIGASAFACSQSDNKMVTGFSCSCSWSAKGSTNIARSASFFRLMNYGEWCSVTICSDLMPTIIRQGIRFKYIVFVSSQKMETASHHLCMSPGAWLHSFWNARVGTVTAGGLEMDLATRCRCCYTIHQFLWLL